MSEGAGQDVGSGRTEAEEQGTSVAEPTEGGPGGYVLDASALLCLINGEPGADRVAAALPSAVISAVNLAEVATKLNDLGADAAEARALLAPLHLSVVPLDADVAYATGALRAVTRAHGLSLADRACLALAVERRATALTSDRAWRDVGEAMSARIELLR